MTNKVLKFKNRSIRKEKPVVARAPAEDQEALSDVADILLSAAYYVNQGRQEDARKLLNYVMAHNPIPIDFYLPADLKELLNKTDYGEAMFPSPF